MSFLPAHDNTKYDEIPTGEMVLVNICDSSGRAKRSYLAMVTRHIDRDDGVTLVAQCGSTVIMARPNEDMTQIIRDEQ